MGGVLAASLLAPNLGLFVWLLVVFLALMFTLRKFAWGPITSALETREQTIADSIRKAEKALEDSRQVQAENDRIRRESEVAARRLLQTAREEAEKLRAEEVLRTREEISRLHQQAQEQIGRSKEQALQQMRSDVADIAIEAAERVLRANLDARRQRDLVTSFLGELGSN